MLIDRDIVIFPFRSLNITTRKYHHPQLFSIIKRKIKNQVKQPFSFIETNEGLDFHIVFLKWFFNCSETM